MTLPVPKRCRYCERDYSVPEDLGKRSPYCSRECFLAAKAIREKLRVLDLHAHGLCPRCKQPVT